MQGSTEGDSLLYQLLGTPGEGDRSSQAFSRRVFPGSCPAWASPEPTTKISKYSEEREAGCGGQRGHYMEVGVKGPWVKKLGPSELVQCWTSRLQTIGRSA